MVFPRWSLALLSVLVAIILAWGAMVLPWAQFTSFSALTVLLAVAHGTTAVIAAMGHRWRVPAWRLQSLVSLAYLAYVTWNLLASATYIAVLYGGLGRGVAAGLAAIWGVILLLTVPLSVWGIAVTGGIPNRRRAEKSSAAVLVLVGTGLFGHARRATGEPVYDASDFTRVERALATGLANTGELPVEGTQPPSLMTRAPAQCPTSPTAEQSTVVATFFASDRGAVETVCMQDENLDTAIRLVAEHLRARAATAPFKLDVVSTVHPLSSVAVVVDNLAIRPGLDGVCHRNRCLMPWQLVALEHLLSFQPLSFIPELRFGFQPHLLVRDLNVPDPGERPSVADLVRIESSSFVMDPRGGIHRVGRLDGEPPPLTPEAVRAAEIAAETHILAAQGEDGRFRYRLDPFTGHVSYRGFSVPRQAGTTLVLCELGRRTSTTNAAVERSLDMLSEIERRHGDLGALHYPAGVDVRRVAIGPTALSLIAFLSCHDRGDRRHDAVIGRLSRFLLAMQRPDGGFFPEFDFGRGAPVVGPDPLYAGGQAVMALVLLENLVARTPSSDLPAQVDVRAAVDRAMDYFADDYWPSFARMFFFLEENWHCLAARAALTHHRNDRYERFCLDYMSFKSRLILDETSDVREDLIGAYGFGNVLPPHTTATAGFGESLAAAMALARARGEEDPQRAERLSLALRYLLTQQWGEVECFACTTDQQVVGGFSEHLASPHIRIDYVQHAWAAIGHGGRVLGLVPEA